jgi:hypothetical protein
MIARDAHQAEILLGVREPLTSWLRQASASAVAALASCPVAIHELRLPKKASANMLAACNDARWLGPVHVAMTAVEATRACSR